MVLARWQATIVDDAGNVQPGASIEVRREEAGAPLANLYSDRDGASPIGNPFIADSEGFAAFHVIGGSYRITATLGGFSRTWRYVGIGNAQAQDGAVAGFRLRFNPDTDDSDPSSGYIKFNNADFSLVTEIYVSNENYLGFDISELLDTFDDGGVISNRGLLTAQFANEDGFFVAQVTGSVEIGGGSPGTYRKLTVTVLAGSNLLSFTDDIVGIVFNQAGGGLAAPVSLADIQQIDTNRVLGRRTAGTGVIEQLAPLDLRQMVANSFPAVNGLIVTNNAGTPTTRLDIDADGAILVDANGVGILTGAVDLTINAATTGANGLDAGSLANNTWYHAYIISNGTTTAGLLSTSATAPTMPSGYTYRYRVGAIRTGGSATFTRIRQLGNRAQYQVVASSTTPNLPVMASGSAGDVASPTYVSVATGAYVPPTARTIHILLGRLGSSGSAAIVSPNNTTGSFNDLTNPPYVGGRSNFADSLTALLNLETSDLYWASNNANNRLNCIGWIDAVNAN